MDGRAICLLVHAGDRNMAAGVDRVCAPKLSGTSKDHAGCGKNDRFRGAVYRFPWDGFLSGPYVYV